MEWRGAVALVTCTSLAGFLELGVSVSGLLTHPWQLCIVQDWTFPLEEVPQKALELCHGLTAAWRRLLH